MDFHESLFARFPSLRPDEPTRLRQDIVDELNDHLVCACNREMLRGVDAPEARRRALERFGDPAAVARRLWLDAMRGKIMAQRVVIGTCAVVVVASVVLVGIFWQQAVRAQMMAARQAAEARFREQEMLNQLKEMTHAIKHPRSLDWNPVQFSFTEEKADGPPARDVSVMLLKLSDPSAKAINRESNEMGVADFGLLNPGQYNFRVSRNWSEVTIQASGTLDVQPGEYLDKQIICPKNGPQQVSVRVECEWPADLKSAPLLLFLSFQFRYLETAPEIQWIRAPSDQFNQSRTILLDPSSAVFNYKRSGIGNSKRAEARDRAETKVGQPARVGNTNYLEIAEAELERKPPDAPVEFEPGNYRLFGLIVLRQLPDIEPGQKRFERLVLAHGPRDYTGGIGGGTDPAMRSRVKQRADLPNQNAFTHGMIELPAELWQRLNDNLVARSGQSNTWTIPLPNELIQAVREALKADKSPKGKPEAKADATKANG